MEKQFNYESAVNNLKRFLGDNPEHVTIYTVVKHVSASGMSRDIQAFIILDNEVKYLGLGNVRGCGMDMGFHCAYEIFGLAYPDLRYQDQLTHRGI